MSDSSQVILFVAAIAFFVGYRIVYQLWPKTTDARPIQPEAPTSEAPEARHRRVLGVAASDGELEIKFAYRAQLAKYHPDKVAHLGGELQDLAASKTREIVEAYEYLKARYGFR